MFRNCKDVVPKNTSLAMIFSAINNGRYKETVNNIRVLYANDHKALAYRLKTCNLPTFSPSGAFINRRSKENIEIYNKLIILDFDNIPDENYNQFSIR